jgi:peptidoglycan-N-acetylglucosamine deacetylase
MYTVKTHNLVKKLLPVMVWDMPVTDKEIYLTFDDGPIPVVTEFVLDTLSQYNAKATFFMVGHNIEKYPEIGKEVIQRGHSIGNHTHNHLNGWKTRLSSYLHNTEACARQMMHLGEGARLQAADKPLFRPPYGKIGFRQLLKLRNTYKIIMWDVLTGDFDSQMTPEHCLQKAIDHTTPGSVVIFHDSLKAEHNLRYTLPRYLEYFVNQGYQFKAL